MPQPQKRWKPIINAHIHIFTGDHVPAFLARSFLFWPIYYLTYIPWMIEIFHYFKEWRSIIRMDVVHPLRRIRSVIASIWLLQMAVTAVIGWLLLNALYFLLDLTNWQGPVESPFLKWCQDCIEWMIGQHILWENTRTADRIMLIALLFLVSPLSRKAIAWSSRG